MKQVILTLISLCTASATVAQESQEVYTFLRLPVSVHAAALGGDNISINDDDASLVFHNPALISNVSDRTLNLNYMTYMEGVKTASAAFVKAWGERATWAVSAQYMDYGDMRQMDASGTDLGDLSVKDIALSASLAYLLGDRWSGGVTLRYITSDLAGYHSQAIAADLGLNYYDEDHGISLSASARNLGGQVQAYADTHEDLPLDVAVGISKRLSAAPLRFSATLSRLNSWDVSLLKHLTIGADVFLGDHVYVAAGYHFRRPSEMRLSDGDGESSHGAGLSCGAGLQLERFKFHVAYARYHVSASSLLLGASYSF